MTSKINMTLPDGVCEKDGQVLMTYEANKKFYSKYGDAIPKIESGCLCIPIKRRTVFLDHDMNMVKIGTVCVLTNERSLISRVNGSDNIENIPGGDHSIKLKDHISDTCYKMLFDTQTTFEFMEITNEKFTKYIPLQFDRRFIYVVVTKMGKITHEELIEEIDESEFNSNKTVSFINPNGYRLYITLNAGKWMTSATYYPDSRDEYVVGAYRV